MTPTPIVALDFATLDEALALVQGLGAHCDFYKIGSELYTASGPEAVRAVTRLGKRVFLDLKFHDIPNTVESAARAAARVGASLITVHASGGEAMLRAAVAGAGPECGVLAVTVLTSLDGESLATAWGREAVDVAAEVLRLSVAASEAGVHGVVCSGHEAAAVRAATGGALAVLVPGIRFASGAFHDQRRVVTPGAAVRAGASYLVLGRAVTADPDPAAAMQRARLEIEEAVKSEHGSLARDS
ncbi:MAG TPA: orotidine-5'-phosphate decarboxylase [Gemmatimonadaceae bacterium]